MSHFILNLAKGVSTRGIVARELDRIEQITGDRPEDWMEEISEIAIQENTDGDTFDFDGFDLQVTVNADHYIDFIRRNYPEQICS